jgi:hypothetical protein
MYDGSPYSAARTQNITLQPPQIQPEESDADVPSPFAYPRGLRPQYRSGLKIHRPSELVPTKVRLVRDRDDQLRPGAARPLAT